MPLYPPPRRTPHPSTLRPIPPISPISRACSSVNKDDPSPPPRRSSSRATPARCRPCTPTSSSPRPARPHRRRAFRCHRYHPPAHQRRPHDRRTRWSARAPSACYVSLDTPADAPVHHLTAWSAGGPVIWSPCARTTTPSTKMTPPGPGAAAWCALMAASRVPPWSNTPPSSPVRSATESPP